MNSTGRSRHQFDSDVAGGNNHGGRSSPDRSGSAGGNNRLYIGCKSLPAFILFERIILYKEAQT